jgi:hypothetical protein
VLHHVVCIRCSLAFPVADGAAKIWVVCPRCRTRNVNNAALKSGTPGHAVARLLGGLLLGAGILFGMCCGMPSLGLLTLMGDPWPMEFWLGFGAWAVVTVSGVILWCGSDSALRRTAWDAGGMFLLMAGAAAAGLAALVVLVLTCWPGRW